MSKDRPKDGGLKENAKPPMSEQEITENLVSLERIKQTLAARGYELIGDREVLSAGFFGPIYRLKIKNKETEEEDFIVEKTFACKGPEDSRDRRFITWQADVDVRSRLGVVDRETGEVCQVVIDWLYNEERALRDLKDVPGVPQSYGAVYDGRRGSILESYVDGYDLAFILDNVQSVEEIEDIFAKIVQIYTAAAEKGYLYNNPASSTVMIDEKTSQPYMIDWYNHSAGSIEAAGPVLDKFIQGLKSIDDYKAIWIKEFLAKQG